MQFLMTTAYQVFDLRRRAPEVPNLGGPVMPEMDEIRLRSAMTFGTVDAIAEEAELITAGLGRHLFAASLAPMESNHT